MVRTISIEEHLEILKDPSVRWVKDAPLPAPTVQACAIVSTRPNSLSLNNLGQEDIDKIYRVLQEQYPRCDCSGSATYFYYITHWNDRHAKSREEVIALLEKASQL